ncbi:MAG: hypothetical protein HWE09_09115 [Cyclobacteriaceae bacterium]|nr:hypothetical protein [Cyclobacteriaceae bacterium]
MCSIVPLVARLLRFQFYNVIKIESGGYYIFFGHRIFFYNFKQLEEIKVERQFRAFRGGVACIGDTLYFGEYFDNASRGEVNCYRLVDRQLSVFYQFPQGSIRHVHSINFNEFDQCLYVLTGDHGNEAKIVRFNTQGFEPEVLLEGNEDYRAIAIHFLETGFVYGTDAQFQTNTFNYYDYQTSEVSVLKELDGPVFYCQPTNKGLLFSTVYEGAPAQQGRLVELFYFDNKTKSIQSVKNWAKDRFNTRYFQFGYIKFPNYSKLESKTFVSASGLVGFSSLLELNIDE